MEREQPETPKTPEQINSGSVEMPRGTAAPLVLAAGVALLAGGIVLGLAMTVVGVVLLFIGLGIWVAHLRPGEGHFHEAFVAPDQRAQPVQGATGGVEQLAIGKPGYRVQLPVMVHPISAGVKGGIVGGLVLPIPAMIWGLTSGHGIWYPANLLAGMALPVIGRLSVHELEQCNLTYLIWALVIHAATCITVGLAYGVLLPMLPAIHRPIAWGGLLMPLLWTAVSFLGMQIVNPVLSRGIDWPAFIASQFVFGLVAALVVMRATKRNPLAAGILAGIVGGLLMLIPAVSWSWLTGHGIFYPGNLLAGIVVPNIDRLPMAELEAFHANWLAYTIAIHAGMSIAFGVLLALLWPKLPRIPGPMAWGGLLMPVLWTAASYSLMDVVNPVLQQRVHWPWFIVSQFVFGIVASIVVVRSQQIVLPPVGGPS